MYKKISALLITVALSTVLTANTFAYSNMYTTDSGIPDFSEVTGASALGKDYVFGGTIYYYILPTATDGFDSGATNWVYNYSRLLVENGYIPYDNEYSANSMIIYFYNSNKGIYVSIHMLDTGVGIMVYK